MNSMPFVAPEEEKLLDPLSEEIAKQIKDIDICIDRFKLREFAYRRAKLILLERNPTWKQDGAISEEALNNLIEFEVRLDYKMDLVSLVIDFRRIYRDSAKRDIATEKETRIQELQQKHAALFESTPEEDQPTLNNVDQPVEDDIGGRTLLHLAAENGDLIQVRKLVEECKANVNVKDNARYTPYDRARFMGHMEIVAYLSNLA